MNNRQIMIEPNMEVFEKLGVKNIEIKNILLNTRTKRITFNCSVSCMGCIDDIDTIYKDVLSKFGSSNACISLGNIISPSISERLL